jgi:hypothetical protein
MISDALLIFLPLRTLRDLKNQPGLRRRLQFTFAASALTTCVSIVSGVLILRNIGIGYVVVVEIEVHRHLLTFVPPFEFVPLSVEPCHLTDLLLYYDTHADVALPPGLQLRLPLQRFPQTYKQIV